MTSGGNRSSDAYRKLMEAVLSGSGLAGVTSTLARLAACDAVSADEEFGPLHAYDGTGAEMNRESCHLASTLKRSILTDLSSRSRKKGDSTLDPLVTEVRDGSGVYIVAAVRLPEQTAGYVWCRLHATILDSDQGLRDLVSEAAAASAVEAVRQRALLEGEQRVRNSFLEDLLSGRLRSVSATRRRAKFLGYDLTGPQAVFTLDLDDFKEYILERSADEATVQRLKHRFRQAVENWLESAWPVPAMVWEHSDALVILAPARDERAAFLQRVETLRNHAQLRLAGPSISAGVGEPRQNMMELPDSYAEADHAVRIGSAVFGAGATTAYRDLGVYRLLFHLRDESELWDFCAETVGPLERYDERHDGSLVETLGTYLDLQGNVTRAAEVLHLHRNGLLYRLSRIETLAGISLSDPTDRLALQLALLARPLVSKRVSDAKPAARSHMDHRPEDADERPA